MRNSGYRRRKSGRSTDIRRPRIITGEARGRRLLTPGGLPGFRPVLDRIKEAVFNILGPDFRFGRVLDLFAGSGSLGLEAASRGASEVVLVERNRKLLDYLRRNASETRLEERCRIVSADAALFLKTCGGTFDLVFADPPFRWAGTDRLGEVVRLAWEKTSPGGTFVLRLPAYASEFHLPPGVRPDVRRYGKSRVVLVRKPAASPEAAPEPSSSTPATVNEDEH